MATTETTTEAGGTAVVTTEGIARRYFNAVGARDVEAMIEIWRPGGTGYIHGMAELRAPEGYREWFGAFFNAFPDLEFTVLEIAVEGEKAAVRWRARGTFSGDGRFEGMVPNGASIDIEGIDLLTIRDGLLQENRAYTNGTELARQLGAMPAAGSRQEKGMLGAFNLKTRISRLLRRR